jgi:polyhydroxyalkanoate synthesis regulator phasin
VAVSEGSVFDRLRARGEEVFTQVSNELMANPRFMKAVERAWQGKAKVDKAVAEALKRMNIPTRTEFRRAVARVQALEREVAGLKEKLKKADRKPTTRKRATKKAPPKAGQAKG